MLVKAVYHSMFDLFLIEMMKNNEKQNDVFVNMKEDFHLVEKCLLTDC